MKRFFVVAVLMVVTATFVLSERSGSITPLQIAHGFYGSML